MMKSYAKKRAAARAVQWTGVMTPEMTALVGEQHLVHVDSNRQLVFSNAKGPGRFAREGDWIISTSGEDLTVIGDDVFRTAYEEVDETVRATPTDAEHEAAGQDFVRELDVLLVAGLKLSREEHANIFRERDRLIRTLSGLLADQSYTAARRERHRVRDKIAKDLTP